MKTKFKKPNFKDGFTIIEVVLVLAIAGLIFLMVFIALPALQRSQRDTQRRDDMARLVTGLTQFAANNRNRVPQFSANARGSSDWGACPLTDEYEAEKAAGDIAFCITYLSSGGDSFEDPDGNNYVFVNGNSGTRAGGDATGEQPSPAPGEAPPADFNHEIHVWYNAKCDGEWVLPSTGTRKVAFQYKLEGGGSVCVSN